MHLSPDSGTTVEGLRDLRWIGPDPTALRSHRHTPSDSDEAALIMRERGGVAAVEAAAARWPDKIVVDDGRLALTYAAYLDRAYGLARRIHAETRRGSVVAAVTYNSSAAPIIILACEMAGRILAPIDASHPAERRATILEAVRPALVVAGLDQEIDLAFVGHIPVLRFDPAAPTGASRPDYTCDPDAPTVIAFTSGSTGRPKGVLGCGRYGFAALSQFIGGLDLRPSDVLLNLSSLSGGGGRDAFGALAVGAKMRILDLREGGVSEMLRVMAAEGATVLSFVPSALRMILAIPGAAEAFRSLRVLDLHGERILTSDIRLFRATLPPTCSISITLGSVEAGVIFSWIVDDDALDGLVAPVGRVVADKRIALVDEDGASVATGEVGELIVRGPMAIGGWRDGAMAPEAFHVDPEDPSLRIYATGDLVVQRPDGLFAYVERRDRRVKINGLWADLVQIEAAVRGLQGVADCAAFVTQGVDGSSRIAIAVAPVEDASLPDEGAVRGAVTREAGASATPSIVLALPSIPRLPSYKADFARLQALASAQLAEASAIRPVPNSRRS